ncbi:Atu4866 domain-containing protein [Actinomadura rubrisoli]|uniref:Atu4866 domain-containing protein n=1 Tax=Actinomadura rubrisoli TaxID=2530368 RepID=UPI001404F4D9|nr:Atu4866 domain-containing protein [Actinomadura rubrisoli]
MSRNLSLGAGAGAALVTALLATAACSSDGDDARAAAPSAVSSSAAPSATASAGGAKPAAPSVVGTWASDDGGLRLVLNADGTFVEDYNGQKAAYAGKYTVSGSTLTLNDKTGVTANGTINGGSISLSGSTLAKKG